MTRANSANMKWVNPAKVASAVELGTSGSAGDDARKVEAGKPEESASVVAASASVDSGAQSSKS